MQVIVLLIFHCNYHKVSDERAAKITHTFSSFAEWYAIKTINTLQFKFLRENCSLKCVTEAVLQSSVCLFIHGHCFARCSLC